MADVDRRSNLTNTTLAEPPLLAARTYAGGLRRARLLASLSFSCRRAPCRGRGEGVCSVLACVANPATTLVCRHWVAQIGPEMPTTLLRFPLGWSLSLSAKTFPPTIQTTCGSFQGGDRRSNLARTMFLPRLCLCWVRYAGQAHHSGEAFA